MNDIGGGVVSAFLHNKMVEVKTDDGFELPVLATELIPEQSSGYGIDEDGPSAGHTIQASETNSVTVTIKTEDFRHKEFNGEAFLAIVPENEKLLHVSDLKLYLINDSNYILDFHIAQTEGKVFEFVKAGRLEPDTKLVIKRYGQATLGKIKTIRLQGIFFKEGLYNPQPAIDNNNNIEGISFYKAAEFKENDYFNSKAIIFKREEINMEEAVKSLSNSDILKVTQSKDSKPKVFQKVTAPKIEEVDLHIEEIVDEHSNLSNGEILEIQMGRFETALETAIKSNSGRIVFIHGVGNGKLKYEISRKLDNKYPELRYQDASFKEYGFGATLVNLR